MKPDLDLRAKVRALEYWLLSLLVALSFLAGLFGALHWLFA